MVSDPIGTAASHAPPCGLPCERSSALEVGCWAGMRAAKPAPHPPVARRPSIAGEPPRPPGHPRIGRPGQLQTDGACGMPRATMAGSSTATRSVPPQRRARARALADALRRFPIRAILTRRHGPQLAL